MFTPIPGEVMDVPVTELLRNLVYSVDQGPLDTPEHWHGLMRYKSEDHTFWQLCDAIPERGFTVPICVRLSPDNDPRRPWAPSGWHLGNGHHRLCAAILLGLDSVKVYFADDEDYSHRGVTSPDSPPENPYADVVPGTTVPDLKDRRAWHAALWFEEVAA